MQRRRLLWQIFPLVMGAVAVSLAALLGFASTALHDFYVEHSTRGLRVDAEMVSHATMDALAAGDTGLFRLQALATKVSGEGDLRVTIIAPDGQVLVESHRRPAGMDNHGNRPEVLAALAGEIGQSLRYSDTLRAEVAYLAMPVERDGNIVAVVRTSVPLASVEQALAALALRLAGGVMVISLLAGCGAWLITRRIVRPLEDLTFAAERFAAGDFSMRLPESGSEEIASLSGAMNAMASQLDARISDLVQQRNEQEAVLSSMVEGVVAVDTDVRIITLNEAAALLLGAKGQKVVGRSLQEVSRTPELQEFVAEALKTSDAVERELSLRGHETLSIQAHGAPVRDASGHRIGAVVVLNDVTKIRRLETVRSDFVANVSHELKTPITSIKGFLETLSDGAIDDPSTARRFLEIAARQADRLGAIIEDLLVLSRLEQDGEGRVIDTAGTVVAEVLASALEVCAPAAEAKSVEVRVQCSDELVAPMNPPLLEQAVVNLLGNAINYSEAGARVEVLARQQGDEVAIAIQDHGCGIEEIHLPRLFERFYRVDKARSRNLGGTGLGLSIVKHIAAAHGGRVEVESSPGKGSKFTITLPQG